MRQRDGVLGGLAHGVRQVEPVEPLVEAAAERVQEDDRAQFGRARPERLEPRVGQLDVSGERRDLHAGEAAAEHRVVEALDDPLGVLQRHESETDEPLGRLRDVRGDQAVGLVRGPHREALRRPRVEVVRRGADPLPVDALRVHVGEAHRHVGELRDAGADHRPRHREALGAVALQLEGSRFADSLGCAALDLGLQRRQQNVGVDVGDVALRLEAGHAGSAILLRDAERSGRRRRHRDCRRSATGRAAPTPRPPRSRAAGGGRGTRPTASSSTRVARDQQLGQDEGVLETLGRALRDRRRAAVRGIPDDDDAAAVPRGIDDVLREPGVVRVRAGFEVGADRVPGPPYARDSSSMMCVASSSEMPKRSSAFSTRKAYMVSSPVGRVAGDVHRAAVVQLGASRRRRGARRTCARCPCPVGSGLVSMPISSRTVELRPSAPIRRSYTPRRLVIDEHLDTGHPLCVDAGDLGAEVHVRAGSLGVLEEDASRDRPAGYPYAPGSPDRPP